MSDGTQAVGAAKALPGLLRPLAGHRAIALGKDLRLVGKHRLDSQRIGFRAKRGFRKPVVVAQGAAQLVQQRILAAEGQVRHPDARRITPAARAATGHCEDVATAAFGQQQRLVPGAVDGVDHRVKALRKDLRSRGFIEKLRHDTNVPGRVNGTRAIGHGLGLLAADLPVHGVELTVHIGQADFVEIHQGEVSHAWASQGFDGPRPDASDANHRDAGFEETLKRGLPV